MKNTKRVKFSPLAEAFSGVQSYTLTRQGVTVKMADGTLRRLSKAKMPPLEKLSAFTLADALE